MKKAFALLFTMILCLILGLLVMSAWREASLRLDLTMAREKYYKNFYLGQLALNYGIAQASNNKCGIFDLKELAGQDVIVTVSDKIVCSEVKDDKKIVCKLSCIMEKSSIKNFSINYPL